MKFLTQDDILCPEFRSWKWAYKQPFVSKMKILMHWPPCIFLIKTPISKTYISRNQMSYKGVKGKANWRAIVYRNCPKCLKSDRNNKAGKIFFLGIIASLEPMIRDILQSRLKCFWTQKIHELKAVLDKLVQDGKCDLENCRGSSV